MSVSHDDDLTSHRVQGDDRCGTECGAWWMHGVVQGGLIAPLSFLGGNL